MALLDTVKKKIGITPQPAGAGSTGILTAIQKVMEKRKKIFREQILIPGHYRVEMAKGEYQELEPILVPFCRELEEAVLLMVKKENYHFDGNDIQVDLVSSESVPMGDFVAIALFAEKQKEESTPRFTLLIFPGTDREEKYPLKDGEYLIGRGRDVDIFPMVEDELMSRSHCLLFVEDGSIFIEDLESSNGVIVNGKRCSMRMELSSGDHFLLGNTEFEVRG